MESEIELNDVIQELHVVSTRPDLFPILIESNFISLLLGLLGHENIGTESTIEYSGSSINLSAFFYFTRYKFGCYSASSGAYWYRIFIGKPRERQKVHRCLDRESNYFSTRVQFGEVRWEKQRRSRLGEQRVRDHREYYRSKARFQLGLDQTRSPPMAT